MLVTQKINKMETILRQMRQQNQRISCSFSIELRKAQKRNHISNLQQLPHHQNYNSLNVCKNSRSTTFGTTFGVKSNLLDNFTTEESQVQPHFIQEENYRMKYKMEENLSPNIVSSNQRGDTLNQIMEEEQFAEQGSFEAMKINPNIFEKFISPNPGLLTKSNVTKKYEEYHGFEADCRSFQHQDSNIHQYDQ